MSELRFETEGRKRSEKPIIKRELPRTWSYEITGNRHASHIYSSILTECNKYLTLEQQKINNHEYQEVRGRPFKERIIVVNKWYRISAIQGMQKLIGFINSIESRLAFQVLGFFLMQVGANISDELKQLILKNTEWKDDAPYLIKRKHQEERKKLLYEFREKIKNYISGIPDLSLKKSQVDGMRLLPPIDHFYQKLGTLESILKETDKLKIKHPELTSFIFELEGLLQQSFKDGYYLDKGLLQYNNFTFIFRDYIDVPRELILAYSHKVCEVQSTYWTELPKELSGFEADFKRDHYDLRLIGSLKTLIPELDIGGDEELFCAWLFVKTPDGKTFPVDFYYRRNALAIAGWLGFLGKDETARRFPERFRDLVNFSPHAFSGDVLEIMIDCLENGLKKVPVSDFSGIYSGVYGSFKMGVRNGRSFIKTLYE